MIRTETITINGKAYTRTYSDLGRMIERDGAIYEEAIDPAELGRTYTETAQPIPDVELTAEEAITILTGGATV